MYAIISLKYNIEKDVMTRRLPWRTVCHDAPFATRRAQVGGKRHGARRAQVEGEEARRAEGTM